jgi:hypothetical protein
MDVRKKISASLNFLIGILSLVGITIACFYGTTDGYSHWSKRLLYFTQLSNIWIGVVCIIVGFLFVLKSKNQRLINVVYVLKYVFTISIAITGIIFCALLAPFADHNIWSYYNFITHVVVPIFAISDFFVNNVKVEIKKKHIFLGLVPPLAYFIFASILSLLNVDFGKGDPYPYFFLNLSSDVGLFGFKYNEVRPELGTFYWIAVISLLILTISWLFYKLHPYSRELRKNRSKEIK